MEKFFAEIPFGQKLILSFIHVETLRLLFLYRKRSHLPLKKREELFIVFTS